MHTHSSLPVVLDKGLLNNMLCVMKGIFNVNNICLLLSRRKPVTLMACVTMRGSPFPAALASHAVQTHPNTPGPLQRVSAFLSYFFFNLFTFYKLSVSTLMVRYSNTVLD